MTKILKKLPTEMLKVVSKMVDLLDGLHTPLNNPNSNSNHRNAKNLSDDETKDFGNILVRYLFPCISDDLVEEAFSISQASLRFLGD